ncbi:Mitochondrial cardiolipin hydrolase [Phytophthora pseudosyringae]|uniref:Mitochondrial cardiolipin hydrolase n=1 Tax=Phytophthora pseudosyringae TaxID=221518 RepID=A0A8T1W386_9STRA|nr:Mitochondrial cardiolipin hydrolase [Phytophthora pseudosyringae]
MAGRGVRQAVGWWLRGFARPAALTFSFALPAAAAQVMGNCLGAETTAATGDSFVDVLFFPDTAMPCKTFHSGEGCTRKNCKKIHDQGSSLLTLLGFLKGARKTMDICVFTITCDEIAEAVLEAFGRGVKVRVITDDGQAKGKGSDIQKFIDAGIPVRDDNAYTYMHHKFCVIDKKTLLNGSFNWSRQAVVGNAENLVIHKDGPVVRRFEEHFEHLWKKYER